MTNGRWVQVKSRGAFCTSVVCNIDAENIKSLRNCCLLLIDCNRNNTISSWQNVPWITNCTLTVGEVWCLTQWIQHRAFGCVQPVTNKAIHTNVCKIVSGPAIGVTGSRRETRSRYQWITLVTWSASTRSLIISVTLSTYLSASSICIKIVLAWTCYTIGVVVYFAVWVHSWVYEVNSTAIICRNSSWTIAGLNLDFFTKSAWSNRISSNASLTEIVFQSNTVRIIKRAQSWWSNNSKVDFALSAVESILNHAVRIRTTSIVECITGKAAETSSC